MATHAVAPGVHAADSSRELVLWAPMPPSSWIRFPWFFSDVMPPRGPLELWLQHADCSAPTTGVEIEPVPTGKIFMIRGWGEIARVCRARGALAIHFEYDSVSTIFFKGFDAEGRRLECCSGDEREADALGAELWRPAVAAADVDGVGASLPWPTVDDGVHHGRM